MKVLVKLALGAALFVAGANPALAQAQGGLKDAYKDYFREHEKCFDSRTY